MKKYKNKTNGKVVEMTPNEMQVDFGRNWTNEWEEVQDASTTFVSKAGRSCVMLDKLSGTWIITDVKPSKGGEKGHNPILTIKQGNIIKRCYVHPSELPKTEEKEGVFTWTIPMITDHSSVTINEGNLAFAW